MSTRLRAIALATVAGTCLGLVQAGHPAPAAVAKKKCKVVVKKIHGKRRHVRVCHKVKPKPPAVKNVTLGLDVAHAATAPMSAAAGGTVSSTNVTLTIPPDALPADTNVTITPVTSIHGLTGKLLAAVQLAPEGLVLAKPATLTIQNGPSRVTAIGWQGNGQLVERAPVTHDGGAIKLSILHFSGAGAYDGDVRGMADLRSTQQALYKDVVRPKVEAALNDDAAIAPALAVFFNWGQAFGLIDDDQFMAAERASLKVLWKQVFVNQVNRAYDSCKTRHDVIKEIINLNRYNLQAEGGDALALQDKQAEQEIADLAANLRQKCGSFELDWDTTLTSTGKTTGWSAHVKVSSLPVQLFGLNGSANFVPVSAPIQVLDFTWYGTCGEHATGSAPRRPFIVNKLTIEGTEDAPKIELDIQDPGDVTGFVTSDTQQCGLGPFTVPTLVSAPWISLYLQQEEAFGFAIRGWTITGGAVWATRTYDRSTPDGAFGEKTTYTLRHEPE